MRVRWIYATVAAITVAVSPLAGGGAAAQSAPPLCGSSAGTPPHITKVMWIFMENQSYGTGSGQIPGSPYASYIDHTLLSQCGSTSDYTAITHPSYPNYLAATSGSTQGTSSDTLGYFSAPNIFGQADPSWRSYEEFISANCSHVTQSGSGGQYYVSRHNPASSYSSVPVGAPTAGDCAAYDESLGSTTAGPLVSDVDGGTLPAFSFVTPGLCNDMHWISGCTHPIASGDAWLATWIPIITAGPDYTSGHLVIDIAWDEGNGGTAGQNCLSSADPSCVVPNIVISPYTTHVVSGSSFSHYSLLKMTETLLGKPYLGAAGAPTTIDMCLDFGLCPQYASTPPTAAFTYSCQDTACNFNGSGSAAPGSGVTSFSWAFGDGGTGSGQTIQHAFAAQGNYPVTLTVTNENGLTDSVTEQVNAASPPQISFIAAAATNGNSPNETVTIPSAVTAGDAMLLVATGMNNVPVTAPAGWNLVGTNASRAMVTSVWSRVATSGDAGQRVTVGFGSSYDKGNVELIDYSGTSTSSPVEAFASTSSVINSLTATTPTATVTDPGSWVVSGWAAKSAAVTSWTTPAGQILRNANYGPTSGARIDQIVTDGGGPAPLGSVGGITASTDQPSADASWTLILAPGP
jgi:PKD repeat protein